ncbi:MAG TPA: carbon-nitrogen hydrolase, partial [Gammaproteobacteria bacterium]|nr:carbon-nitrogen hydrolase [Gammaproteobacteria bacterium]
MSDRIIRVALVQHGCNTDSEANLAATIAGIENAAANGAQLVLLQELHRGSYFCQVEDASNFDQAETIPGPTTERLGKLAAQHQLVIVASLFEKRTAGLYHNTAVVLDADGSIAGRYRKMHIPDDPGYYEKYYFTPGDLGFTPIDTSLGRLGVLVCWDQWYPEAARLMALAGAELLLYPTAIGWDYDDSSDEQARQRDAWLTVQRGHAISNCLPVLICNRIGHEPDSSGATAGIRFWGSSSVIGPQGELLAQAGTDDAETLVVPV